MSDIDYDATQDPTQVDTGSTSFEPIDADGDGAADGVTGFLEGWGDLAIIDLDDDAVADLVQVDSNGDGYVDFVVQRDGDNFYLSQDADFDGASDADIVLSAAELQDQFPDLWVLLDGGAAAPVDPGVSGPSVTEGQVIGDPWQFGDLWFEQAYNGYCVPSAMVQIYELYTGQDVSDTAFVDLANEEGVWVVSGGVPGMTTQGMIALLNEAGIPTDGPTFDHDLNDLAVALTEGKPVLVGVDAGEYWYGEEEDTDTEVDHQVIVTGISADGSTIYLSDTGTPDGNMLEVPADVFVDAWADSSYEMVTVTQGVDDYRDETLGGGAQTISADVPTSEETATTSDSVNADFPVSLPGDTAVSDTVLSTLMRSSWVLLPVVLGVTAAGAAFAKRPRP